MPDDFALILAAVANGAGVIGSFILYRHSFSLAPAPYTGFAGNDVHEVLAVWKRGNDMRVRWQRLGFALLAISYLLNVVALLLGKI